MRYLRDLPLRRKLLMLMMLTSTAALVFVAVAFATYEWFLLRDTAQRDLQTQAEILAANVSAAIAFDDTDHAREVLQSLKTRPQFDLACLFDENQKLLASYTNGASPGEVAWPSPRPEGVYGSGGKLAVFQPVIHRNDPVGTLFLRAEFHPLQTLFRQYLSLAAIVLILCWLASFWIAERLQNVVSQPILQLGKTSREVSERKDYSLRANPGGKDEVGRLIHDFNDMLAQIQTRDAALQKAHDSLELRVAERTQELQQEIVERRRIEAALADEKERLAVTLRSIGDGVVATDPQGKIGLFNPVAEQLTGWTAAEATDHPLAEVLRLVDQKTRQPAPNPVEEVMQKQRFVEVGEHVLLLGHDGTERLIASSGAPIRDRAGQIIGVVLVFRDVTDKERTAQELLKASKLESIGLLAGGIAHDFNNILTAILGNLSLARLYAAPEGELATALLAAEKASVRAGGLTRQLLTFAKGGFPVKKTASLPEIIKETISFVLHGSSVRLQLSLADDLRPAEIDVGQISQVLHNLALNAVQAMPRGGLLQVRAINETLDEHSSLRLRPGRYIAISIQDQGTGIAPENLSRIFDPYFTTKKQGSGLGLAMSHSIIQKHDGSLTVESELGRGTTFHVRLPATSDEPTPVAEPVASIAIGKGRVLVMDDELPILDLVEIMLRHLGYEVQTAPDGAAAVTLFEQALTEKKPFDVVILDLTVPGGMGGKEALQRLRELDPQIKAIVSSGYSEDAVVGHYREHGFTATMSKPYSTQDLGRTLHEVLTPPAT